jgi:transposase
MISRIYVGIDISKRWFDVKLMLAKNDDSAIARFAYDEGEVACFVEKLRTLGARRVHVCMEHTGGYETRLALACIEAGFIVSIVDGAKIKDYRGSFSRTGASTDKKSAYLLARYCLERRPERWFPMPDEYRKLRELVRHRQRLMEERDGWACRASHDVEDELVHAQRSTLVEVHRTMVKDIEKRLAEHVKAHPGLARAVQLLVSIPGIAFKSACRILGEVGPIENYNSAKELALSAGLVPIRIESGQKVPPGKLPIYGNKELRCALFFPSMVCKRTGKGVATFIERVGRNNKLKISAIVAGMRKLAHVVYGVLSTQTPYREDLLSKTS